MRGRLWRSANPALPDEERHRLVGELMDARRMLRGNPSEECRLIARAAVDQAKRALGERGPPWWDDGAPDYNRRMVANTLYASWYESLARAEQA